MPVLTALLGQTAPPNPVLPPNNLSDSKGMHVGEGDSVGARWRQGWVSSLSPQLPPPRPVAAHRPAASCTALHAASERRGYQQNCLHQRQLLIILKKIIASEEGFFPSGNHMGSQDLIKPVVILIACSLRGRGEGKTSPLWGKEPGYQGHLCTQRPLSRREKHRADKVLPFVPLAGPGSEQEGG